MLRFLTTLIILLISIGQIFANENSVKEIDIIGNQRIDVETITSYADIQLDDIYTDEKGNEILKALFKTELFSNIEIKFNNNKLIISIIENPTINLIKFVGNKKIKDEDLLIEIQLKERSVYSRTKVKKDIERILSLYQRNGRLSSEVIPKIETLENNRINLTYEILESEISKVSRLVFIGNDSFSSSKLKSIMKTKEKRFLRFFSSADRYDPDKIEYDKQLISQFYNNNGFPNFSFTSSIAQLSENTNNFEVILYINEGNKYKFGDIEVTTKLKKINSQLALSLISANKGDIFDRSKISDSIETIKELAEGEGYSFIEINPFFRENSKDKTINIEIDINEGPRVYVNSINIIGNTRTLDRVIRREMGLSEGDAYNKFTMDYSKGSIRALDFFSKVEITDEKSNFSDKVNLIVEVEEKNTGEASIGAGYSSSTSGSITLGLRENNFLGKGQKVKFAASFANTRNTYDISITEPYFNNKNLLVSADLYSNFTDPASVNYETEDIGVGFALGFPLASDKSIRTKYSLYTSKVKPDSSATVYERLLGGTDTVSQIGYIFSFDRRNNPYKPSRGYNLKLSQDLAGLGGTSYYYRNTAEFNVYKRLSDKFIGALKVSGGSVNGYNGKYQPLSSNFRLGGKKLRGFKSGKIGPKTGTSYTGGQYFYLTSLETNIDLNFDAYDITSTLFIDLGSVWGLENPAYSDINDDHNLRSSAGINFNWDSPIGPINFVYAQILESELTDTTDNLYFDIGYNF
tara:strand:- start:3971 stop:6217 length:2247 start_codon:yes stop_codon:yes gene_type:complete